MKNLYLSVVVCVLWLIALRGSARAQNSGALQEQTAAEQPVSTTVCNLIKHSSAFDGKPVSIRAAAVGGWGHGIVLHDERCKIGLRMDADEAVREQGDYKSFLQALLKEAGSVATPPKRVSATFNGVFDFRPKEPRLKWWLLVERISDIEVTQGKGAGAETTPARWTFPGLRRSWGFPKGRPV